MSFGLSFKKRRGVKSKTTYILLSRGNRLESSGSLLRMQSIKLRMVYILLRMSVIDIANESSSRFRHVYNSEIAAKPSSAARLIPILGR
jgi:hypothetical protein